MPDGTMLKQIAIFFEEENDRERFKRYFPRGF